MDTTEFENSLRAEGFDEVLTRTLQAHQQIPEHTHPFDARILVLEGEMTIAWQGQQRTCRPGDIVMMAAGVLHTESCGPSGVRFLAGRRNSATGA